LGELFGVEQLKFGEASYTEGTMHHRHHDRQVLSLVECLIGFEPGAWSSSALRILPILPSFRAAARWGYLQNFWGFPYLHVAIHLLEQARFL